jgi:hypothetical protein
MSLSSLIGGRSEVRRGLTADLRGRVLETAGGSAQEAEQDAAIGAAAVSAFTKAGEAAGFTRLELLLAKGPKQSTLTAVRANAFLLAAVDPARGTAELEKALQSWEVAPASRASPAPPADGPRVPLPSPSAPAAAPAAPRAAAATGDPPGGCPWAALRRALVRGQLTEASARQRELGAAAGDARRPGGEPLGAAERERAMQVLLEGIGSVMAGDGVGGGRTLGELAAESQPNLSFRWAALHWSAWAALRSGNLPLARARVRDALTIARQLDMEARAVSQLTAAEILAQDGDPTRALAWLKESRARFERLGDGWGLGQTWLAEARILAAGRREQEGAEAARRACAASPGWDEPPIFLARRALMRQDLAAAEEILRPVKSPAADRVRALIEAIRQGTVSLGHASDFLKEQDAPPSAQAIKTLERIANASPGFVQAREVLAWMLLKLGRYTDAGAIFRGLLARQLTPADRASVMLGLGCIAHTQRTEVEPEKRLQAVVNASKAAPPPLPAADASPLPALPGSSVLTASNGSSAVFSGQLSVFALPDLLEFLRSARRTGLLVCSSAAGMGALRFREGWITGAASPGTPELGELLVSAQKLSAEALRQVAAQQAGEQRDHVIGELLVREGLVEEAAVQEALSRQIELTVRELVRWKDGEFAFNHDGEEAAARSSISVAIDPQGVLLNAFKEMDEASRSPAVDVKF